jgi:hypothetical protein
MTAEIIVKALQGTAAGGRRRTTRKDTNTHTHTQTDGGSIVFDRDLREILGGK